MTAKRATKRLLSLLMVLSHSTRLMLVLHSSRRRPSGLYSTGVSLEWSSGSTTAMMTRIGSVSVVEGMTAGRWSSATTARFGTTWSASAYGTSTTLGTRKTLGTAGAVSSIARVISTIDYHRRSRPSHQRTRNSHRTASTRLTPSCFIHRHYRSLPVLRNGVPGSYQPCLLRLQGEVISVEGTRWSSLVGRVGQRAPLLGTAPLRRRETLLITFKSIQHRHQANSTTISLL